MMMMMMIPRSIAPFYKRLVIQRYLTHNVRGLCSVTQPQQINCHRENFPKTYLPRQGNSLFINDYIQRRHYSRDSLAYYMSSENPPIKLAQEALECVHSFIGLPWWASIMLTTIGLRIFMTVPLGIFTLHNSARLELLQIESGKMAQQLKGEIMSAKKSYNWTEKEMHRQFKINMKRIMSGLYHRDNCHPMKNTVMAWIQIPLWISMSLALRNMSGSIPIKGSENVVTATAMANEGCLWFPDLLACDSTYILPVAVCLFNLLNIEMFNLEAAKLTRFRTILTNLLRTLSVLMIPIAANLPSCMALYWATSSGFSIGQNLLFKLPTFRRLCRVPEVQNESPTPIRDIRQKAIEKYFSRKGRGQ